MHHEKHVRRRDHRRQPDIKKLSQALIELAQAQAEKDAALTAPVFRRTKPKRAGP